jgi:hydroxymethylglutaryl-CoA reductase
MSRSSRIPGFYKLAPADRRAQIAAVADLTGADLSALDVGALGLDGADMMVENVIGTFELPFGVGMNCTINDADVLVPMVVEEPSVIAAVSNMARVVRSSGGFQAGAGHSIMIGQIQLVDLEDTDIAAARLEAALPDLMEKASRVHPRLTERGGGVRDMRVRRVQYDEPGETPEEMLVLHFDLDCVDAMGANMVNTVAERLAPDVEAVTGGAVALRILSNLASRRLAWASCHIDPRCLDTRSLNGDEVAAGVARAYRFAWADPWRAATHNKGVLNGIDAVALATGNDWRAIEAGAHAWAARSGQYRSLTTWRVGDDGFLNGSIELPMQVGTVGGAIHNHPTVALAHKILGHPRARELAGIMAAIGLAQNLGALRALVTEGIQRGHMRMHARTVAVQAGATGDEVAGVVQVLSAEQEWSLERARAVLASLRATG